MKACKIWCFTSLFIDVKKSVHQEKPVVENLKTKEDKVEQSSESKEEKHKNKTERWHYSSCHLQITSSGFLSNFDVWKNKSPWKILSMKMHQNIYQQKTTHLNSQLKHSLQKKSLELFWQACFKVKLATIGDDYEITKVEDEEIMTATFKSRGNTWLG